MSLSDLHYQLEALQQQVDTLQSAIDNPAQLQSMLPETIQALQTSLAELRRANEALHQHNTALVDAYEVAEEAHQRYQDLFDSAPDAYLVTDTEGIIQEANRAAAALLATPQHQLMGKSLAIFVSQEEQQSFRQQLAAFETVPRVWDVRLQPHAGQPFYAALTMAVMHSPQGECVGLRWLLRDITHRKQVEAVLRESEARHQAIWQTAVDGIITINEGGIVESFNPAAERLFGYTATDVIGQNVRLLMPSPYQEEHDRYIARYLSTGEKKIIGIGREVSGQRRDGTTFPMALAVSEMRLGDRRVFTGIVHDLTAFRRVEEALRQQAMLVETSYEPILVWDLGQGIVLWNQGCEQLYGYTKAEALGRVSHDLLHTVHPVPLEQFTTMLWRDRQWSGELRHTTRAGREVIVESRHQLVETEGRWVVLETNRDITVRKQAEAAIRQARDELELRVQERTAELVAANEEVKRFAYIVSHDLRAPLVNLKGFSGELQVACTLLQGVLPTVLPHLDTPQRAEVSRALEQDVPEALGFINASVTRMDRLIQAILRLSRLGRRELHFEPLDMQALVHGIVRTLTHQLAQHQAQVRVGPLPETMADRTAMEQIMGNLLANAVAYLEPGRPGEIVVTAERCPEAMVFQVRDNGRGIATEDIPKVFELFRRVGKQNVPGEGMGLAYVQMLVRRHGGDMRCQSTVGVGTTLTFTIAHQLT